MPSSTSLADNKSLQRYLHSKALYAGIIDGIWGQASHAAAKKLLGPASASWPRERALVAVAQSMFKELGFYGAAIDGIAGPASQAAREKWQDHITFVRPSPDPTGGVKSSMVWPRQSECLEFYGTPNRPDTGWDIVRVTLPYERKLAWDLDSKVTKAPIHAKCREAYLAVHEDILAHYGLDGIRELHIDHWGGTLAVRTMRNGSSWSMHAFGCAEDLDPARNGLRTPMAQAQFGKPVYAPMLDIWEKHGAISLGRARNFDPMHFQFARL